MRTTGDYIFVKSLFAKSVVGRDAWQRSIAQPLRISLGINVGSRLKRMALTDDLRRTLNYDSLSAKIVDQVETRNYETVEQLASQVAQTIQSQLSTGESTQVEVSQPKARLLAKSRNTTVNTNANTVIETIMGLNLPTIIGINELERLHHQIVELDLEVQRVPNAEVFTHDLVEEIADKSQKSRYLTIESFANRIAEHLCSLEAVQRAVVRAGKPSALNWADSAQVQVERTPRDFSPLFDVSKTSKTVYIAFGTNQGDCIGNIRNSISHLNAAGVKVLQTSGIYLSEPMYHADQPPFFNGVFRCSTELSPTDLLTKLKEIEYGVYNRVKKFNNGPRTMDLDILLYNDDVIDLENLKVPHIDMLNRSFVLKPLNDVVPGSSASHPAFPEEGILEGSETRIVPLYTSDMAPSVPRVLEVGHNTVIMSIMNATADSFSDGGDMLRGDIHQIALSHLQNGAQILDIGGQSTRPGAEWIGTEEESRRVCEAIQQVRANADTANAIISVDTCWGSVAEAALAAGANIINDVFSGTMDPYILSVAAKTGAPLILSHSRGDPATMNTLTDYPRGVVQGVAHELRERIDAALSAGCQSWQLILDPGLGFAKTGDQNLELIRNFAELKTCSTLTSGLPQLPWLVGPSRKGFIGRLTAEREPRNRVAGTLAVVTALRQQGTEIIRVHDTKPVWQALQVADAVYR